MLNNLPNFKNLMPENVRDVFETSSKITNDYFTQVYEMNIKFAQDIWALWSKKNDEVSKD